MQYTDSQFRDIVVTPAFEALDPKDYQAEFQRLGENIKRKRVIYVAIAVSVILALVISVVTSSGAAVGLVGMLVLFALITVGGTAYQSGLRKMIQSTPGFVAEKGTRRG